LTDWVLQILVEALRAVPRQVDVVVGLSAASKSMANTFAER
jgi:hypothetical protein